MNAYLTYAAMIGAGLYGIEHELPLDREFKGNGYLATGCSACRARCTRRSELERSEAAVEIFGQDVVDHYLNAARVEQEPTTRRPPVGPRTLSRAWLTPGWTRTRRGFRGGHPFPSASTWAAHPARTHGPARSLRRCGPAIAELEAGEAGTSAAIGALA